MTFGENGFFYELVPGWGKRLLQYNVSTVPGICIDSDDRIYVLSRGIPPIMVLDTEGNVLEHWGDGIFVRAHGVFLNADGTVWCADDAGHAVYKFDADRQLVMTLGTKGVPSDTGCIDKRWQTIKQSAGPFNYPTNVSVAENGDIYVSDGYGNARVHAFSPDGTLRFSWGTPGDGNGEFNLPHSLRFGPDGRLYVCDRANDRIQIFDKDGHYLDQWNCFIRPADLCFGRDGVVYVAECKRSSVFDDVPSRVTILDLRGNVLARVGGNCVNTAEGGHHTAHGVALDSKGNLYIAEVGTEYPAGYVGLRKFRRVRDQSSSKPEMMRA